jgi:LCP family protein required for cell wall assembly
VSGRLSDAPGAGRLRQRVLVALAGVTILIVAAYLALIVVTRIDELFFPGQGLSVGGLGVLPGVQGDGAGDRQINILVMGLDRRPVEGDAPTRTDTMFVLTIDTRANKAGILGIPRDLWVEIPAQAGSGFYEDRINTAYVAGETLGYSGGGPALAKTVVERNLGIAIDHYVIIDFEGFIKVIDDLGGVDIYVEEEINDPFYSRTELPGDYYPLFFPVGLQHMDGETALDYSRTRFGSSDLDRIHRQQQVIFAAIDKGFERGLVDVNRLVDLWGRYKDAIVTDINDLQAPGFATLAVQIEPSEIVALSLGKATVPWVTPEGAAVLLADKELVQELVDALFTDEPASTAPAFVEVQNAAGADGLAGLVVDYLTDFGFSKESLAAANAAGGAVHPLTEIIDFAGRDDVARRLASVLGVAPEQVRAAGPEDGALRTIATADIVVILGADAQERDFMAGASDG